MTWSTDDCLATLIGRLRAKSHCRRYGLGQSQALEINGIERAIDVDIANACNEVVERMVESDVGDDLAADQRAFQSYVQFALRCCESTRTTMTSLSAGIALLEENSTE